MEIFYTKIINLSFFSFKIFTIYSFYNSFFSVIIYQSFSNTNINKIIDQIPNYLKRIGKCDVFAKSLADQLDQVGIDYKIIRVDSEYGVYSDKACDTIGNGYHYGIQIGNNVYDNMTPQGMNFNEWIHDLGLDKGINDIEWNYTSYITNKLGVSRKGYYGII